MNIVSVCSNRSLNSLHRHTEKLLVCSISHALLFGRVWRMDSLLAIESPLTFSSLSSQLVGR